MLGKATWQHRIPKKTFRRPGLCSAPDPARGAYSAPTNPLAGGEGLAAPPKEPHPSLSALRASPLLPPTPKLVPTPLLITTKWRHYDLTESNWPKNKLFCLIFWERKPSQFLSPGMATLCYKVDRLVGHASRFKDVNNQTRWSFLEHPIAVCHDYSHQLTPSSCLLMFAGSVLLFGCIQAPVVRHHGH